MGQYWIIVNIDRRLVLERRGLLKLGEFFFANNPADTLISWLAKPLPLTDDYSWYYNHRSEVGTWAGQRIVCFGNETYDCPSGIFSADEMSEIKKYKDEENESNIDFYTYFREEYEGIQEYPMGGGLEHSGRHVWVLRNLSKKVFVRSDTVSAIRLPSSDRHNPGMRKGLFHGNPGLGHVLLIRICWSTSPSAAMTYRGKDGLGITRGGWVGDMFDIVLWDEFEKEIHCGLRDEWKDITKEIVEELSEVWFSEDMYE